MAKGKQGGHMPRHPLPPSRRNPYWESRIAELEAENKRLEGLSESVATDMYLKGSIDSKCEIRDLKVERDKLREALAETDALKEFFNWVLDEDYNLDEFDILDQGVKLGLLQPRPATIDDMNETCEYDVGDTIYERTFELPAVPKPEEGDNG